MSASPGSDDGVEPWMVSDPGALTDAAADLVAMAEVVDEEDATVSAGIGDAASSLGWSGQPLVPGMQAAADTGSMLAALAGDLRGASEALTKLAGLIDVHGAELRRKRAERDGVPESDSANFHAFLMIEDVDPETRARLAMRIEDLRQDLLEADTVCSDTLSAATMSLDRVNRPGIQVGFLRSMAPEGSWRQFVAHDLVPDPAVEDRILIALHPYECPTADDARAALDELDAKHLDAFLHRNPRIAELLARDQSPPTHPAATPLLNASFTGSVFSGGKPTDVVAVAQAWDDLTADERARLRAYYPAYIGGLDGVPPEHRAGANQWLIGPALTDVEAQIGRLDADPHHDPDEMKELVGRAELYRSLTGPAETGRGGPTIDGGHVVLDADTPAVLLFDPTGDGRYAQWHGSFGATNVAIYTPGTGMTMGGNDAADDFMRDLASEPDTAGISWMGVDLPDDIPDAAKTQHSIDGGDALLRFTEGLNLRDRQVLTAIGYSAGGGIVGYADAIGAKFDRVITLAPSGSGLEIGGAPSEYPDLAWDRTDRSHVQRFTQTVSGDPIHIAHQSDDLKVILAILAPTSLIWSHDKGHGPDPNNQEQVVRLQPGRSCLDGEPSPCSGDSLGSYDPHKEVLWPESDGRNNIIGVVTHGDVLPHPSRRPNGTVEGRLYPLEQITPEGVILDDETFHNIIENVVEP